MLRSAELCEPATQGDSRSAALTVGKLTGVIREMRDDPSRDFKTSLAAARLAVSPESFIRAFKQVTGLSPQRFHAALRIESAKRLLVETNRPVTEISLDVGYSSLGTFVRTFALLVGVPPGQLRRLARGDGLSAAAAAAAAAFGSGLRGDPASALAVRLQAIPAGRMLAVGLFPQSIPAGLPFDGCFVDPLAPTATLAWPSGCRRVSLLAAAIGPFCIRDAWAGRLDALHVCQNSVVPSARAAGPLPLQLRRLAETDPPFLTPVPLLMLLQSGRSGKGPRSATLAPIQEEQR
jgi:AraC-like DNA-binding protein